MENLQQKIWAIRDTQKKVPALKVLFSANTIPSQSKEYFLCDSDSEAKFVSLISKKLEQTVSHVTYTTGDVDHNIAVTDVIELLWKAVTVKGSPYDNLKFKSVRRNIYVIMYNTGGNKTNVRKWGSFSIQVEGSFDLKNLLKKRIYFLRRSLTLPRPRFFL